MKILMLDIDGVINTAREPMRGTFTKRGRFKSKVKGKWWKLICFLHLQQPYLKLFSSYNEDKFDPYSIYWLNQLLKDIPDLQIVVSSVWRFLGLIELKRIFKRAGVDPNRIISSTPSVNSFRGIEVKAWLEDNLERNPKMPRDNRREWDKHNEYNTHHKFVALMDSKTAYVCIDDDSDFFPDQNLVQTDGHDGLSHKEYLIIRKLFGIVSKWD